MNNTIGDALNINSRIKMNHGGSMPYFGLGVWKIPDGKKVFDAVTFALKSGYRLIDTAKIYQNEKGVGEAIRKSGIPREEIFLITKLWETDDVQGEFDKSLERLGLDYVDLYLIHWPFESRLEAWRVMEKLVKTKHCRAIGVSNFSISNLKELLNRAKVIPAVNQIELNPYINQKELSNFCTSQNIIVQAWSPLGRAEILDNAELVEIASHYDKTVAQILLRWCIQKGISTIPKSENPKRILENADIFDFEISKEDMKLLDSL